MDSRLVADDPFWRAQMTGLRADFETAIMSVRDLIRVKCTNKLTWPNEAHIDDACHEVAIRLIKALKNRQYDPSRSKSPTQPWIPWVETIASNTARSMATHMSRRRYLAYLDENEPQYSTCDPSLLLEKRELGERAMNCLQELQCLQQQILGHRFGLGSDGKARTQEEVADLLGLSIKRVRKLERGALAALRRMLNPEN